MTPASAQQTAERLRAVADVAAVTLTHDEPREGGQPSLELVVADRDGVPPHVLATLADADLSVTDVSQRGDPVHHVVLAV